MRKRINILGPRMVLIFQHETAVVAIPVVPVSIKPLGLPSLIPAVLGLLPPRYKVSSASARSE
jgi:hypothetical protein